MNEIFIKILFIVCIINVTSYCGVKEAFAYLQQNRDAINDALSQCPEAVIKFPLCGPFMEEFKTALNSDAVIDDTTMVKTVSMYVNSIDRMAYLLNNRKTEVVSDDISVTFLAKTIICSGNDRDDRIIATSAAQTLVNRTSFASLKKHKTLLDTTLNKSCVNFGLKNEIRILMGGLKDSEKKELLASGGVSLPYRARLGDTLAIKQLRTQYLDRTDFHRKELAIYEIFHSGQMDLIRMVISDFNDPTYRIYSYRSAPPCTSSSTIDAILNGVRRSYPYEKLLNEDLIELLYVRDRNSSVEHNKRYNELVTKWLEKQYGVKINDKPKAFIIRKFLGCINMG